MCRKEDLRDPDVILTDGHEIFRIPSAGRGARGETSEHPSERRIAEYE
jgi:hypothetical protein